MSDEYLQLRFCTAPGKSCELDHVSVICQLHASHCDYVSAASVYCYTPSCYFKTMATNC